MSSRGTGGNMSRRSSADFISTGHESSWTMYLDDSSVSGKWTQRTYDVLVGKEQEETEEESLSTVSDASSGSPHCKFGDSGNDGNEFSSFLASSGTNAVTRDGKQKHKEKQAKENGVKQSISTSLQETSKIQTYKCTSSSLISGRPGCSKGSPK